MRTQLFLIAFLTSVVATFTGPAMANDETLSGSVTYLDRRAVPPGAVLSVELVDVSLADAASVRLSSRLYLIDHVPFAFQLHYDPSLIESRMSYAIQAIISLNGKALYRSTTHFPALTRNAPEQVDVVVERMPAASPGLEGSKWQVFEMTGRMLISEKRPGISFLPEGRVVIDSTCNSYRGPVTISASSIRFSDKMAGTRMACAPPYDKLESDMMAILPQVTGWLRSGDRLAMTNEAGVTVLRLSLIK